MKPAPYRFRQRSDHARQKAFAEAYVHNGGNAAAAAEAAGYSKSTAPALMQRAEVLGLIAEASRNMLVELTPQLVQVLSGLALDPSVKPKDRLAAANSLLDRGELKRSSTVEHEHQLIDPQALISEVWEKGADRRAALPPPQVIDAEAEEVDAS